MEKRATGITVSQKPPARAPVAELARPRADQAGRNNARIILVALAAVAGAYALLELVLGLSPGGLPEAFGVNRILVHVQEQLAANRLFIYALCISVPVTLILETIIPADPNQTLWNGAVRQDVVYLVLTKLFNGTVIVWYAAFLGELYQTHFSALTIESLSTLPAPARFALGILAADFLAWLHHVVRHKVPWFWHFHVIHHAQRSMNLFTNFRVHLLEFVIAQTIIFVPLFMLAFETPQVLVYSLFSMFLTQFYHGNVRTDLGWFRFVLITPGVHRIHHSALPEHRDKNFGVVFSIWDRIFGTYTNDASVPPTGVADDSFPHPRDESGKEIAISLLRQLAYPFRRIAGIGN